MKKPQKLGQKKNFKFTIGIIGVGYVGLPLAVNFSNHFNTISYDNNRNRINELKNRKDRNLHFNSSSLSKNKLKFTSNHKELKQCNVYIVTLPTPINHNNLPDLRMVKSASVGISKILKKNDFVIFESTFYPGTVEDLLIPILEKKSNLKYKKDFHVGYSPERINPGDKKHTLVNIRKIVSSDSHVGKKKIKYLYKKIIKAGLHEVSTIKAAELSKLLENSQRFINIALMNQISTLCNKINIQTKEVIDAAASKWNFMRFYPGLVGGHCVAVDPLYLSYIQNKFGLSSSLIDTSNKINNGKVQEIVDEILENSKKKIKILILGATFKENCPDFRNSGTLSIIKSLNKKKIIPHLHDPYMSISKDKIFSKYKFNQVLNLKPLKYDSIMISVSHDIYKRLGINKIKKLSKKKNCKIIDLKSIFKKNKVSYQL
tara:strand:+ start:1280 stop:2569 length:1290 start_codon:yes stop_codon:yes gene_type:complete